MNIDVIYLNEKIGGKEIYISDKRITIERRTFPIDHVSSVELHIRPYRWNMIFFILVGIFCIIGWWSTWNNTFFSQPISPYYHIGFVIGVLLCAYIVYRFGKLRYEFSVRIGSTSGIINAFTTGVFDDAEKLVEYIKRAITNRQRS